MIEKTAKGVPCKYCGAPATQEKNSVPVCDKCAVEHIEDIKTDNVFDA